MYAVICFRRWFEREHISVLVNLIDEIWFSEQIYYEENWGDIYALEQKKKKEVYMITILIKISHTKCVNIDIIYQVFRHNFCVELIIRTSFLILLIDCLKTTF